jgi:hypothetical protein
VSGRPPGDPQAEQGARSVSVPLTGFAWESIEQESARLGVPIQELVSFAVLYYLADVDSGRIARRISRSPYPDAAPAEDPPTEDPSAGASS